jgi:hypothetical protein
VNFFPERMTMNAAYLLKINILDPLHKFCIHKGFVPMGEILVAFGQQEGEQLQVIMA